MRATAAAIGVLISALAVSPAHALDTATDGSGVKSQPCTAVSSGSASETGFGAGVMQQCGPDDLGEKPAPYYVHEPVCQAGGSCATCPPQHVFSHTWLVFPDGTRTSQSVGCVPVAQGGLAIVDVARAFARLDLPAPRLVIEPPDAFTLVNFDTNFYTTSTTPVTRRVTLLGQQVTIEATPSRFHWDFDDGRTLTTTEPGAAYPSLRITHNYLRKGTYHPSLGTTYTGRYRVGGGTWQDIPGAVTVDGTAQSLRAIEARPKLVGY